MNRLKNVDISGYLIRGLAVGAISLLLTCSVFADPVLDNVAAGQVSIQQTPGSTVVNQSSQQAILNWQSFNISHGESTHFNQPTGGIALNRINPSQGASQIYGSLTATGQIILMNPAGVYFGPSAYVNVGGLIATTANMSDQHFMDGIYQFSSVDGYSGAIVNEGQIIAAQNGLVALVAPGVINKGLIQANLGSVVLASGEAFTLDFTGDQMINFAIDKQTASRGIDKDGHELTDGVENTGSIISHGGKILVTASDASSVLDRAINLEGIVDARSVATRKGVVIISANPERGVVRVAAKVNVSGKHAGERGGKVTVTGHNILLDAGTVVDASGDSGGGDVLIGGNYQGIGPLGHANAVVMMPDAVINADAITSGDGGNVVLWSDYVTNAYGSITAKGGALSGSGGLVETSSKQFLDVNGIRVNTLAPNGVAGEWLLDPSDITISNAATSGVDTSGNPYVPTADSGILNAAQLGIALQSNNITVVTTNATGTQEGNISFADAAGDLSANWNAATTLTLQADNNIFINNPIALNTNQVLTLRAGFTNTAGSITTNAIINGVSAGAGTLNMQAGTAGTIVVNNHIGTTNGTALGTQLAQVNVNSPITLNANILTSGDQTYTGAVTPGISSTLRTTGANSTLTITQPLSWLTSMMLSLTTNTTSGSLVLSDINIPNGGIFLTSSNTPTGISSNISVIANEFRLASGQWNQIGPVLPTFQVTSFRLSGPSNNVSFIRALDGDGSGGNPYQITDVYGLQGIGSSSATLAANYVLANDIDASGTANWNFGAGLNPLGNSGTPFTGIFDGQGYSISDLTIIRNSNNTGMFISNEGTLRHFTLAGGLISGAFFVGGIVVNNGNTFGNIGVIDNVHSSATVSGSNYVGGLVAFNYTDQNNILASSIINSSFSGVMNLASCQFCGGIVGQNYGIVDSVINRGTITVAGTSLSNYIGGIAGINSYDFNQQASITNAFNFGTINVTNTDIVGGVVGATDDLTILSNVGNAGTINVVNSGAAVSIGGVLGAGIGTITNVYNEGNITLNGAANLGGIVGNTFTNMAVVNAYNTGNITAINDAGSNIGGIVGYSLPISSDSVYNTGYISGVNGSIDALFGTPTAGFTNAYYHSETSGAGAVNGGTALTSAQMRQEASYVGFDFGSAWAIVEGQSYAYLQAFYPVAPRAVNGVGTGVNDTVGIVINGVQANTATGANGAYYLLAGNNVISGIDTTIANGTPLLVFNISGDAANNVAIAGAGAINPAALITNTITVGSNAPATYTNTTFATAIGAVTSPNILYSLVGNDLILGNASYPSINLTTTANATFTTNGTISSYTGGTSNLTFNGVLNLNNNITNVGFQTYNGAVVLGADIELISDGGDIAFNSTIDRDTTVRNLIINAGSGALTLSDDVGFGSNNRIGSLTLLSSGLTSINGNVNADGLTTDASGVTSVGAAIIDMTGDTTFNDAVTLTGAAKAITADNVTFNGSLAADTSATFTATAIHFLNGLTGNGALSATGTGVDNTLAVNSGNAQHYSISGTDVGMLTVAAGFTGSLSFTNIQNLIGGMEGNDFVFSDNAIITGSIDGNNPSQVNVIDLTAYTQDILIAMAGIQEGVVFNAVDDVITNYFNVNVVTAESTQNNTLRTPIAAASTVNIVDDGIGNVNTVFGFSGFNTFYGTQSSTANFPPETTTHVNGTNVYTTNNYAMQFYNFGTYTPSFAVPADLTVVGLGNIPNIIQQPIVNAEQQNSAPRELIPAWQSRGNAVGDNLMSQQQSVIDDQEIKLQKLNNCLAKLPRQSGNVDLQSSCF